MGLGARWRDFRAARAGHRAFKALSRARRRIVLYSEGRGYWTHFEPIFRALRDRHGEEVVYVGSDRGDPLLLDPPDGLVPFYVGDGTVRTLFFAGLEADVALMTMPDLQTFHIKRSPHPVHYVYVHHSIVSTHMVYRPEAFDHFDTVLCVGPHHVEEIRAREKLEGLPPKRLVEHGYGRLDRILADGAPGASPRNGEAPPQILVAPSWGEDGLIERFGARALRPLVEAGLRVVLRPHPRTSRTHREVLDAIAAEFREVPAFTLDEDMDSHASLAGSDVMVSDWSGAALEFALGRERPVLFVDVPRKVRNPEYERLEIEPLEVRVREEVGAVVPEEDLGSLGRRAVEMVERSADWRDRIQAVRGRCVFNVGRSGDVAAEHIASLLS